MKKILLMILLYTPFTHALESDAAYEFSAGVGHQYAGVIGAGIGVSRQDEYGFFGDNKNIESKTVMTLNLGYKF